MNTTNNADAGKNVLWPGATGLSPFFGAKTPYGVPGRSRPQCSTPASSVRLAGCHPQSAATSCHNRLDDLCNL